jgi:RNA polymerase sigma factor (sigma-70 family)
MPDDGSNASPSAPPEMDRWKPVNDLYAQWKSATDHEREGILHKLDPHLTQHAERMVWKHLHFTDNFLVREMVDDLKVDLHSFKENSKFSSWAHSRFRFRCISEWRFRKKFLGESLEEYRELFGDRDEPAFEEPGTDSKIYVEQVLTTLGPRDREILEAHMRGDTLTVIGEKHGKTSAGVRYILKRKIPVQLRGKLGPSAIDGPG